VQHLSRLTKLKTLSIQSNRITKIGSLEGLVNLEELYLSHNGLDTIEGLTENSKLTTLDIGGNRIKVIEGVDHLRLLNEFWANDNQIASILPLEAQLGPLRCPELNTVYLEGNPVQKQEGSTYRKKIMLSLPQISQIDAT
jgi:protein phosphatase 1 regulatory subunit 7